MLSMLGTALPAILNIIDKVIPDKALAEKVKLEMLKMQHEGRLKELEAAMNTAVAQLEVNKAEAASDSKFKSWWRPFIGWGCGFALYYIYLISPFFTALSTLFMTGHWVSPPLDMETLMGILGGMLGLGGLRTWDKHVQVKAQILNRQQFFDSVRQQSGSLNQKQVELLNKALDNATTE